MYPVTSAFSLLLHFMTAIMALAVTTGPVQNPICRHPIIFMIVWCSWIEFVKWMCESLDRDVQEEEEPKEIGVHAARD